MPAHNATASQPINRCCAEPACAGTSSIATAPTDTYGGLHCLRNNMQLQPPHLQIQSRRQPCLASTRIIPHWYIVVYNTAQPGSPPPLGHQCWAPAAAASPMQQQICGGGTCAAGCCCCCAAATGAISRLPAACQHHIATSSARLDRRSRHTADWPASHLASVASSWLPWQAARPTQPA
jgi:hypothetical protein